jgi:lipoate-protein ligase A
MARDAALLARSSNTGESVLSIYSWERPTLSFGRNQRALGQYDVARISERGMDVVRRPTGGRAILHHREITYSVTAPIRGTESLRMAYERINLVLIDGLRRLGVDAEISRGGRAMKPGSNPCFEAPADGEIVSGGRKLVGSAQWRGEAAYLQHGSILVDDDQSDLSTLAAGGISEAAVTPPRPATLLALLGRAPDSGEVAAAMFDALREKEQSEGAGLGEDEIREAALDLVPDYLDDEWTWRR